jgi:glycine hydroxymethyltransferase
MCRSSLAETIDKALFPGFQGGPHDNAIAGVGLCLEKVLKPAWVIYAKQVIKNAQAMAKEFEKLNYQIVSDGTDNHLFVIDLTNKNITGKEAEIILAKNNILVSRSTIPGDPRPPYNPSGIRLGTPAITTRGFKAKDAVALARLIDQALTGKNVKTAVKALCQNFKIS